MMITYKHVHGWSDQNVFIWEQSMTTMELLRSTWFMSGDFSSCKSKMQIGSYIKLT